jgi:RimJ/RimL family protein N-acetyltransferase
MIEFVPYAAAHLPALRLQRAQAEAGTLLATPGYAASLANAYAWTGLIGGRVAGVGGVLPQWRGRAVAWALIAEILTAREFLRAHHKVAAVLATARRDGWRRIETTVDAGFDAGHRWVRALGFVPEGLMRGYSPEGRDHVLYAQLSERELT